MDRHARVVGLCGSPSDGSDTRIALRRALGAAAGASTEPAAGN